MALIKNTENCTTDSFSIENDELVSDCSIPSVAKNRADGFYLGMFAFGICTFYLGIFFVQNKEIHSLALFQGFFFGGCGQVLSGILALESGIIVGCFIFTLFGIWWLALASISFFTSGLSFGGNVGYSIVWLSFLLVALSVFFSKGREDIASPITGILVCTTNILLIITDGATKGEYRFAESLLRISGVTCMLAGIGGFYIGSGKFLNHIYEQDIIPMGFSKINKVK